MCMKTTQVPPSGNTVWWGTQTLIQKYTPHNRKQQDREESGSRALIIIITVPTLPQCVAGSI